MKILLAIPFALISFAPMSFAQRAGADDFAPMALNSVGSVPAKIAGAKVMDEHGVEVGSVSRIEADAMGKPLKADITLTSGQIIFLDASALGYDQNANVLVTAQDQKQLAQMAQAPKG
jgi:hypothetical protein